MSDNTRDNTGDNTDSDATTGKIPVTSDPSRDTTRDNTRDTTRDNTLDFGEEFGVVKFADSDDSSPAIRVDSTDSAQLPHWSEAPTGEAPRFGVQPRDPSRPVPRLHSRRESPNARHRSREHRPQSPHCVASASEPSGTRGSHSYRRRRHRPACPSSVGHSSHDARPHRRNSPHTNSRNPSSRHG